MQPADESQSWSPGQSLWSLIVEHVPESELPEVRAALGDSLVDMYTEVYSEVEMWDEIWQGIQRGGNHGNRVATQPSRQRGSPLADPPVVKELLRAEIQMLLQSVRERASREGRDAEDVLLRYNSHTVNYAMAYPNKCPGNWSYPGNWSCPGNTNLSQHGSRSSSRCSVQSSVQDEVEAVRDKLNVTDIDQVLAHLRSVLMQECEALRSQVKHVQEDIQQKHSSQREDKTEPTISELREQRRVIQMDLELPTPVLTRLPSFSSSSSSSSSPSSPSLMEDLKNRSRLSAGQRAFDKTLQPLIPPSVLRPHPPPLLSHTKPSPPASAALTKTSAARRSIRTSSLARTQGQHGRGPASTEPQTHHSHRISTEGPESAPFAASRPRCGGERLAAEIDNHCFPCPEKESAGSQHRRTLRSSPGIQTEAERNLSSHGRSPEVRRSRNTNDIPSPVPALSSQSDANSCNRQQRPNERWDGVCRDSLGETQAQNDRRSSISDRFLSNAVKKHLSMLETRGLLALNSSDYDINCKSHSVPAIGGLQTQNGSRENIAAISRYSNGHCGKDVSQQKSPRSQFVADQTSSVTPRRPVISGTQRQGACTQPAPTGTEGQFFSSLAGQFGATSQPTRDKETQKELECPMYSQPVPPATPRLSSRGQALIRQQGLIQGDSLVGM